MTRTSTRRRFPALVGLLRSLLVAGLVASGCAAAGAQTLATALSASRIEITSNFSGTELQVFGVVEHDRLNAAGQPAPFDVVVTVTGPAERVAVRRKERVGGVWLNRSSVTFDDVPAFFALATSGPLDRITGSPEPDLVTFGAGKMVPEQTLSAEDRAYWRAALVRERTRAGMWEEAIGGVEQITPRFFRAQVALPAHVGAGSYQVTVSLLSEGQRIALDRQSFTIAKTGFEARVADLARLQPFLYGLAVVVLALGTGWIGGFVFRRD